MMNMIIKYIVAIVFFLFVPSVSAYGAYIYVDVDASGNETGADWTNAYTSLQTAENTVSRGDTIYVAEGTYYEAVTFNVAESGTTPIIVSKCGTQDSICTSASGYSADDHDNQAVFTQSSGSVWTVETGYWTFDGVTGGGPESWDSGHGFKLNNTATSGTVRGFMCVSDIDNVELKRIEIQMSGNQDEGGIYPFYSTNSSGDLENWLIQRCYFHDSNAATILTKGHDGLVAEYNLFARNHSDAAYHGEAWTAEYDDNITVRYNIFEDNYGSGIIFFKTNAHCSPAIDGWEVYGNLFWWSPSFRSIPQFRGTATGGDSVTMIDTTASFPTDGSLVGVSIGNNSDGYDASCTVTSNTETSITCSGGLTGSGSWDNGDVYNITHGAASGVLGRQLERDECGGNEGYVTNLKFYNNTIAYINHGCWDGTKKVCAASSGTIYIAEGEGNIAKNNIVIGAQGAYTDWTGVSASHNWYYDILHTSNGTNKTAILASESNGQQGAEEIFIDSDTRTGFSLSSATLGGDSTIGTNYDIDMLGNTRGADGLWDRGAFEYQEITQLYCSDVDNSGGVTTVDALLTLRRSLGLDMSGTGWQIGATTGDANCDGACNSSDALLILRYSLGLDMNGTGWCG